ncbi:PIG-L deacetylase family protein [Thermotoga sp. KOL6]|uniref:PIG-L deacetylase family protein n=1 Tax=Thermotoga sp. KOL6 TaxID=126741 RepID=UPI000C7618CF|nr:PIG-L deacetylase family protein [Thermotoga sp. KOL6]PLV58284.1 hypothetical protein AS005_07895 [Thermotoga sp. KOL6]
MKKILVVAAHSDDPIIGMGGTIKRMREAGFEVWVLSICGDRIKGFEEAVRFLGGNPLNFDFSYSNIDEKVLAENLTDLMKRLNPDIVFTHWIKEILFDHQLVSEITLKLARRKEKEIFAFEIPASSLDFSFDIAVDITEFYEAKKEAIEMMKGAFQTRVFEEEILPSVIYTSGFRGIQVGCKFAEVFKHFGSRFPLSPYSRKLFDISRL